MIYYPTSKSDNGTYRDYKWAHDGEHTLKGLMKFGADILPAGPFRHIQSIKQNVKVNAPINKREEGKFVPIIFSHGVGNTMTWFSTIIKDLAS